MEIRRYEANNNKASRADDADLGAGRSDDDSDRTHSRSILRWHKSKAFVLHHRRTSQKSNERSQSMKGLYGKGLVLFVLGGAGLAEHITSDRGSFPISAVVFGLGFILILMSYGKENNHRR